MLPLQQVQSNQCQSKLAQRVVFCGTVVPNADLERAWIYYLRVMTIRGLRWPQMVLQRCIGTLEGSFLETPYTIIFHLQLLRQPGFFGSFSAFSQLAVLSLLPLLPPGFVPLPHLCEDDYWFVSEFTEVIHSSLTLQSKI